MHKDDFHMRLTAASYWAWREMQRYVIDKLPPGFRYDCVLRKNGGVNSETAGTFLSAAELVDIVMKDGSVPVWIDLMVDRVEKSTTVFSVECSDRYESDESMFYYTWSGSAPFGIKCGHFPKTWLEAELRGVPPKMKFRLCPTFWNRISDFLLLRWLFCRLDTRLVAKHMTRPGIHAEHFFCAQERIDGKGMLVMEVPAGISDKRDLFDFYSKSFRFPDRFGRNWDALLDCLKDIAMQSFARILIRHKDVPFADASNDREAYLKVLLFVEMLNKGGMVVAFPDETLCEVDNMLLSYWQSRDPNIKTQMDVVNCVLRTVQSERRGVPIKTSCDSEVDG